MMPHAAHHSHSRAWSQPPQTASREKSIAHRAALNCRFVFGKRPDECWQLILWSDETEIHLSANNLSLCKNVTELPSFLSSLSPSLSRSRCSHVLLSDRADWHVLEGQLNVSTVKSTCCVTVLFHYRHGSTRLGNSAFPMQLSSTVSWWEVDRGAVFCLAAFFWSSLQLQTHSLHLSYGPQCGFIRSRHWFRWRSSKSLNRDRW